MATIRVTDMTDIASMTTPLLWNLAELALNDYRWATARRCLDELGLRLDNAYERLQHRKTTGTYTRPEGAMLPTLRELHVSSHDLPSCYQPVIADRIKAVNDLVKLGGREAATVGL